MSIDGERQRRILASQMGVSLALRIFHYLVMGWWLMYRTSTISMMNTSTSYFGPFLRVLALPRLATGNISDTDGFSYPLLGQLNPSYPMASYPLRSVELIVPLHDQFSRISHHILGHQPIKAFLCLFSYASYRRPNNWAFSLRSSCIW